MLMRIFTSLYTEIEFLKSLHTKMILVIFTLNEFQGIDGHYFCINLNYVTGTIATQMTRIIIDSHNGEEKISVEIPIIIFVGKDLRKSIFCVTGCEDF
jgi:hypothetical protein